MCEYFSRIQSNFFLRNCEQNLSYPVVKDKASENISLTFVAKSSEVVNAVTFSIDVPIQNFLFCHLPDHMEALHTHLVLENVLFFS